MGLLLKDKDYEVKDGTVTALSGAEELLGRVLFLLQARRGSFPLLPEVGSRLHLLRNARPDQWESLARLYVAEALSGEQALTVKSVTVRREGERLWVETELDWKGTALTAETDV